MPRPAESAFIFIHIDEMQDFLRGLSPRFQEMHLKGNNIATQEHLFGLSLRHRPDVYLLVFTSIVGEWSRELGRDALRVTLFDQRTGCFLGLIPLKSIILRLLSFCLRAIYVASVSFVISFESFLNFTFIFNLKNGN